jgi:hypothetical protein
MTLSLELLEQYALAIDAGMAELMASPRVPSIPRPATALDWSAWL